MWYPTCLYGRWVYTESQCRHKRDKALNCRAQPSAEPGKGSSVPQHPQTQPRWGSWGAQVTPQSQRFLGKHQGSLLNFLLQSQTLWRRLCTSPLPQENSSLQAGAKACSFNNILSVWLNIIKSSKDTELSQHCHPHPCLLLKGFPPGVWLCWPGHGHGHHRTLFALKEKGAEGQCLCLPTHPQWIPEPSANLSQMWQRRRSLQLVPLIFTWVIWKRPAGKGCGVWELCLCQPPPDSSGSGLVVGAKPGQGQLCLLMSHQKVTSPSCEPKLDLSQNPKVRNFIIHSLGEALGCYTGGDWRVLWQSTATAHRPLSPAGQGSQCLWVAWLLPRLGSNSRSAGSCAGDASHAGVRTLSTLQPFSRTLHTFSWLLKKAVSFQHWSLHLHEPSPEIWALHRGKGGRELFLLGLMLLLQGLAVSYYPNWS